MVLMLVFMGLYHSAENLGVQCDVIFHGRFQDELDG